MAVPQRQSIVSQMIQGLQLSEPALDTTIGSPIRNLLDVVSEAISEAYADQFLLGYLYDIDSKAGPDLDNFVAVFGFTRYAAKRATGTITFSRQTAATNDIFIPAGSQISTASTPPIIFSTTVPVIFPIGQTSINVPIQAAIGGSNGNVSAGTITQPITSLGAISVITNQNGLSGGVGPESDDQLRARFEATVFRALTGTEQMFLATALDDPDVTNANVVGATLTFSERIQLSSGAGASSVQDLKYFYANTSYLGTDIFNGDIFTPGSQYSIATFSLATPGIVSATTSGSGGTLTGPTGFQYGVTARTPAGETPIGTLSTTVTTSGGTTSSNSLSWTAVPNAFSYGVYQKIGSGAVLFLTQVTGTTYIDTGALTAAGAPPTVNTTASAPIVQSLDPTNVPDGVYDLQYNYLPVSSRNDPVNKITNRIDVYCNGIRSIEATQVTSFSEALVFNGTTTDPTYRLNFERDDGSTPVNGNYFIPFAYSPVNDPALSNEIIIGPNVYVLGTDFWLVNDITAFGLGPLSKSGIEWKSAANGSIDVPTVGAQINLDYSFNQIPLSVQKAIQNWRLVTTDIMVHQAKQLNLNVYLGVILQNASFSPSSVLSQISTAIETYLASISFAGVVQVSQIIAVVQAVTGVVAVRLLTSADSSQVLFGTGSFNGGNASTHYAIQSMNDAGAVIETFASDVSGQIARATDVLLTQDTLANLNDVYISLLAQNTFGSV